MLFIHDLFRRTSTPRCEDDDHLSCKDHTGGITVLAFNTKIERVVHRGTCLGRYNTSFNHSFGIFNGPVTVKNEYHHHCC